MRFPSFTTSEPFDEALLARLPEADDREAHAIIECALGDVSKLIECIVGKEIARDRQAQEDLIAEARQRLVQRLLRFRGESSNPIERWRSYAAQTVYRLCDGHRQSSDPARHRLRKEIQQIIERQGSGLDLWFTKGERWCGFSAWSGRTMTPRSLARLQQLRRDAAGVWRLISSDLPEQPAPRVELRVKALMTAALLNWFGEPMTLEMIVDAIAGHAGKVTSPQGDPSASELVASNNVEAEVIAQENLVENWRFIAQLEAHQRSVILLPLPVEHLKCFLAASACTHYDLATAMKLTSGELTLHLSQEKGFPDDEIARRLGCKRQKVINDRRTAREKLARLERAASALAKEASAPGCGSDRSSPRTGNDWTISQSLHAGRTTRLQEGARGTATTK